MSPLLAMLLCIGEVVATTLIAIAFHERGYQRGVNAAAKKYYDLGYECGRTAGEKWLVNLETSVQEEREQIWREEAQL